MNDRTGMAASYDVLMLAMETVFPRKKGERQYCESIGRLWMQTRPIAVFMF